MKENTYHIIFNIKQNPIINYLSKEAVKETSCKVIRACTVSRVYSLALAHSPTSFGLLNATLSLRFTYLSSQFEVLIHVLTSPKVALLLDKGY